MKPNVFITAIMVIGLVFYSASICLAQEGQMDEPLIVEDAVICMDVIDRIPLEPGLVFSSDIGRLYCFTRIVGAKTDIEITHNWYYNDRQVASVPLAVRSSNWRTFSSKKILPTYKGNWKVEVLASDGQILKEITFTIQ
jgi:hypothetical protein